MNDFVQNTNQKMNQIIKRTQVDTSFAYRNDELLDLKMKFLAQNCEKVLDIGKSSRDRYDFFKKGRILTMDINQYKGYPDIVDDICCLHHVEKDSFDAVICMAVLEHVYDPKEAVRNIHNIIKEGGYFIGFAPFITRYHASNDVPYHDFYRYTKDGLAYLFRDFSEVTLYPVRGRLSIIFNLAARWKFVVEKRLGQGLNKIMDSFCSLPQRFVQVSGYNIWAKK